MPLFADVAVASLAPADGKAQHAFCMVVRWRHTGLLQKYPKRVHLTQEPGCELSCIVLIAVMPAYQFYEAGIEGTPFTESWWCMGHMAQSSELSVRICAEFGDFFAFAFRELFGIADQVRQTGLAQPDPVRLGPVAVCYKDPFPLFYELFEGCLGPIAVNHEKRHVSAGQHPELAERCFEAPGGFIDMVYRLFACLFPNCLIVGLDGL